MAVHFEVRKIEDAFGEDRWEMRVGDISGSTVLHNVSKEDVIQAFIDELVDKAEGEKKSDVADFCLQLKNELINVGIDRTTYEMICALIDDLSNL